MIGQLTNRNNMGSRPSFPALNPFRHELDELINRVWGGEVDWLSADATVPAMNLSETDDCYTVSLDLPGVDSNEVDIHVNGNVLTVTGERKGEFEDKGRTFHRTERSYGMFARSVSLPCEVLEDKVSAKLEGGVLKIDLPKAAEAKPRKIKVSK